MSFSFDESLTTDLDFVRFKLDDVERDDPRLSDELIESLLDKFGLVGALIEGCNRIILFYGKEPSTIVTGGGKRVSFQDRHDAYMQLKKELVEEFGAAAYGSGGQTGVLPFSQTDEDQFLPAQPFFNSPVGTEGDMRVRVRNVLRWR